jgi:hypothetical protein
MFEWLVVSPLKEFDRPIGLHPARQKDLELLPTIFYLLFHEVCRFSRPKVFVERNWVCKKGKCLILLNRQTEQGANGKRAQPINIEKERIN